MMCGSGTRSFEDFSANQWLGLTPHSVVAATLNLDAATIAAMRKDKPLLMPEQP
jgi:oxalate decarboxylase